MSAPKFKYVVPKEDSTQIEVSKDTRSALKFFAKSEGLTMVVATYLVIRAGFTYLLAKDQIREQELIKKVMKLGKLDTINLSRKRTLVI